MARCPQCTRSYTPLPHLGSLNVSHLSVCPRCGTLILRDRHNLGEMLADEDKADPESWGDCGWT